MYVCIGVISYCMYRLISFVIIYLYQLIGHGAASLIKKKIAKIFATVRPMIFLFPEW